MFREVSGSCPEKLWTCSGNVMEIVRKVSGKNSNTFWKNSRMFVSGNVPKLFRIVSGNFPEMFEKSLICSISWRLGGPWSV